MSQQLIRLKSAMSLAELALLLRFKPAALSFILYRQPDSEKYTTFKIPKRNGDTRTIKAPEKRLKLLQRRLSDLLQDCVDEINAAARRKDRAAHGFKRGRSIITNARRHRHRRYVFNVDIEDFFPSINFGRVRGLFIKSRDFALREDVATVIAQIACHENSLPQGSPCSPVISNLIGHLLDMHLVRLAGTAGCTYSRYADDLTFSTNKKQFPSEIAKPSEDDPHVWVPGNALQRLIGLSGFRLNLSKTRMQYRTSRQDVTGLVVNRQIGVRDEYRHTVRAMVRRLITTGKFQLLGPKRVGEAIVLEERDGSLNELAGMLGFVDSIDLYNRRNRSGPTHSRLSGRERTYRQFLLYRNFFAADSPVVVCEGDTDNIYLTHAIRSLAADFPVLAHVSTDGKVQLKVRLYKYPRTSTARVLGLGHGGSGELTGFVGRYQSVTKSFTAPGEENAVIVLFDNDNGAKSIKSEVRKILKRDPDWAKPFVRVTGNLYTISTPLKEGAPESKIEDFFDESTRAAVVGGKTFSGSNSFDTALHYGKRVFAQQVVRQRAQSLDFSGFRPLLRALTETIRSHAATLNSGRASP